MRKIITFYLNILLISTVSICFAEETKTEDKNNDGKPDMWIYYDENKRPVKIENDRNFDGRPDMYSYYQYSQRIKLEIDSDYDGKLDQVNEYREGRVVKMQKADK